MPALTIKNITDAIYQQLKTAAELHRRSINSEVLIYLERALIATKTSSTERLSRIEQLRANIKPNSITPEDIEQAINSGRP
jgi:plasmid stability protein